MDGIHYHDLRLLHLLWVLPLLVLFYIYVGHAKRAALERFAEAGMISKLNLSVSPVRQRLKAVLFAAGLIFIVIAMTRPAWNPIAQKVERRGRDVIFILDCSRSMLAEDLKPNRLERAKIAIDDVLAELQGDRVGLILFAGTSVVKCPLTLDYGFFRMALKEVSVTSVTRGGTMIGDAIRKALDEGFDDLEKKYKDIILITDGGDQGSFPEQAAEKAGERGVRILAVGLGDDVRGELIPVTDKQGRRSFVKDGGDFHRSHLDATTLRKVVNQSRGGKYFGVGTGTIDLGQVYRELIASAEKREVESMILTRFEEKFQWFLALALILLALEAVQSERKVRGGAHRGGNKGGPS